jgi:hypothetical protein
VCNPLKREGIPSYIDAQDLLQVGYEALIYTVHKDPTYHGTIPLASRVARNARTAMVRFIEKRRRETRYVQVARTRANLGPECKAQGAQGRPYGRTGPVVVWTDVQAPRQLKIVTLPLVPPGKESSGRRELIRLSRLAA